MLQVSLDFCLHLPYSLNCLITIRNKRFFHLFEEGRFLSLGTPVPPQAKLAIMT